MKKLTLLLGILLVLCTAFAETSERNLELHFKAGTSLPMKPDTFTDFWNPGFSLGGGMGIQINPSLLFIAQIDYNNFGLNETAFLDEVDPDNIVDKLTGGSISC